VYRILEIGSTGGNWGDGWIWGERLENSKAWVARSDGREEARAGMLLHIQAFITAERDATILDFAVLLA
jgi:hypothetical protein